MIRGYYYDKVIIDEKKCIEGCNNDTSGNNTYCCPTHKMIQNAWNLSGNDIKDEVGTNTPCLYGGCKKKSIMGHTTCKDHYDIFPKWVEDNFPMPLLCSWKNCNKERCEGAITCNDHITMIEKYIEGRKKVCLYQHCRVVPVDGQFCCQDHRIRMNAYKKNYK